MVTNAADQVPAEVSYQRRAESSLTRRKIMKRLFLSVFLILGWVNADALTLAQLRTQIRRDVGDTPSTQDLRRYGNTALNAYVNEAQRTVVNLTWPMEDRQNFSLSRPHDVLQLAHQLSCDQGRDVQARHATPRSSLKKSPSIA
jgi:hypothetical protein